MHNAGPEAVLIKVGKVAPVALGESVRVRLGEQKEKDRNLSGPVPLLWWIVGW